MQDRLANALQLRETGRARQDQTMLEEARTLLLTNLLETTSDETLQYYKRGLLYDASHLDETWE